jgi:hypothetical protein
MPETLESEITAVVWLKKGDTVIRPKVTYAFTDRLEGIIGGELWSGPAPISLPGCTAPQPPAWSCKSASSMCAPDVVFLLQESA